MDLKNITSADIRKFSPCEEGISDFEYKHPTFRGTLSELLLLQDISYSNKMWLCGKILPEKIAQKWSLECAKSVHRLYLEVFPDDTVLYEVFESIEKVINEELPESAARSAESAAWSARSAAECC